MRTLELLKSHFLTLTLVSVAIFGSVLPLLLVVPASAEPLQAATNLPANRCYTRTATTYNQITCPAGVRPVSATSCVLVESFNERGTTSTLSYELNCSTKVRGARITPVAVTRVAPGCYIVNATDLNNLKYISTECSNQNGGNDTIRRSVENGSCYVKNTNANGNNNNPFRFQACNTILVSAVAPPGTPPPTTPQPNGAPTPIQGSPGNPTNNPPSSPGASTDNTPLPDENSDVGSQDGVDEALLDNKFEFGGGAEECAPASGGELTTENCGIVGLLVDAINILSALAGMAIIASIMIGGYQYMTARDNSGAVEAARKRILWAMIALAIFIFMYAALNWLVPGGTL